MYITLEADYAVRIVHVLVNADGRLDAKTIADRSCVTLRFALKILRKLVTNGIIKSFKGTSGGYELAKNPSEIKLRDVIETVEGTYFFSRCLIEHYPCTRTGDESDNCPYHNVFKEVSDVVRDKLGEYSFDMFKDKK